MSAIDYRLIKKHELASYLASAEYLDSNVWPISPHRGESYCNHPEAEDNDVLLFLAYKRDLPVPDQLVGYLGIFPQRIYLADAKFRVGFYSCMWVNPITRGMGIAKNFMRLAFEHWDDQLMVTEFTPAAKGLYDKTGNFRDLRISEGLRCYLRTDMAEILPRKLGLGDGPLAQAGKKLLSGTDKAAALISRPAMKKWLKLPSGLAVNFLDKLSTDRHADFIAACSSDDFCRRGVKELNWIVSYPWLLEGPETSETKKYHFSSVADQFQMTFVELLEGDKLIGLMLISIRNGFAKIPHAYFPEGKQSELLSVVYKFLIEQNAHTLLLFHPLLVNDIRNDRNPFLHLREATRHYIVSTKILDHFPSSQSLPVFQMQDGNGDAAFT